MFVLYVPAGHSVGVEVPVLGQYEPEVQDKHEPEDVNDVPPVEYVPIAQGLRVPEVCPAIQKKPGGHVC